MKKAGFLLVIAALATPASSTAHRGSAGKGYVSTIAGLVPNVLGVSVNVLGGDDRLRLSNYSDKNVVILGYEGEPYLRFTRSGVFENIRSPAAYLNRFRYPAGLAPGAADAAAPPEWRRVRPGVSFEWHDHRIHWTGKRPPPAVDEGRDKAHLIFNWRVPGRADGKAFAITGFLGYVPRPGARKTQRGWVVPTTGAALGAAALAALWVGMGARRRQRRAP
jgi:hypothetical protein